MKAVLAQLIKFGFKKLFGGVEKTHPAAQAKG